MGSIVSRPATLSTVVSALENAEVVLGLKLARSSPGTAQYVKFSGDSAWVQIFTRASVGAKLRLQFERKGFRPVSSTLLADALTVAALPRRGDER